MRISTKLGIAALVPALMALFMGLGLWVSSRSVSALQEQQALAARMAADLNELNDLARSYESGHQDRPRRQFLLKHDHAVSLVSRAMASRSSHPEQLQAISADLDLLKTLFLRIVNNYETGGAETGDALFIQAEQRLSGQLFIRSRDANIEASRLNEALSDDIVRQQQRLSGLLTGFVALTAVALTIVLLGLMRSVTTSLALLRDGTEAIGTGNLSHRMNLTSPDELGDLGRSFDRMAGRLQALTVSRAELGAEVDERKRAQDLARQELETTRLLLHAAEALSASPRLDDVLQTLADVAVQSTEGFRSTVYLMDPTRTRVTLAALRGGDRSPFGEVLEVANFSSALRGLLEHGGVEIIDTGPGRSDSRVADKFAIVRALIATIGRREEPLGFISLDQPGVAADFSQREIDLLQGLASEASVAIENARLSEAERVRARVSGTLADLSTVLAASKNLEDDLPGVLERASDVLDAVGALLSDRIEGGWCSRAVYGVAPEARGQCRGDDESPARAEAFRTKEPVLVSDTETHPHADRELAAAHGYRAYISLPLIVRDEVVATVTFLFGQPKRTLTYVETDFLDRFAYVISVSMENARLLESEQRRRRRVEALHQVTEVAVSALDPAGVGLSVLDYLVEHHGFELASVWMERGGMLEMVAQVAYPEAYARELSPLPLSSDYDAARVYQTSQPSIVEDVADAPPSVGERYRALGMEVGAYAILPLRSRGRTIGTFHFGWHKPRRIAAEDVEFYASLGNELGVVLENARLYETEHDIAERLQSALLALPDRVAGVDFAHAYHSASESARVGGDFYDLFEMDEGHVGVTIGDVAGKGLNAAVLTSLVKNTIRAHAAEKGATPARILELTNDVVYRATPTESFVTVFFGVIDTRTGRVVYANAGHTTTAVSSERAGVRHLRQTGPILGAFEHVAFEECEICCLEPDDLLLLYTDGLIEARHDHVLYGEERLFALLAKMGDRTPIDAVQEVLDDVLTFTGMELQDDLAILVVRRLEPDAVTPVQQKLEL